MHIHGLATSKSADNRHNTERPSRANSSQLYYYFIADFNKKSQAAQDNYSLV